MNPLIVIILAAVGFLAVATSAGASERRARTNFVLHCSGCHQTDGTGSAEHGIPNMKDRVGHFLRTPDGRAFLVQVPGTSQSSLNDADTAELLNWMLVAVGKSSVPADFLPFTASEVSELRAHPLNDSAGVRKSIGLQLRSIGFVVD